MSTEKLLEACVDYRKLVDELTFERDTLRDEVDTWASRCAAAIWLLPDNITAGRIKEAQDAFSAKLDEVQKRAAAAENVIAAVDAITDYSNTGAPHFENWDYLFDDLKEALETYHAQRRHGATKDENNH